MWHNLTSGTVWIYNGSKSSLRSKQPTLALTEIDPISGKKKTVINFVIELNRCFTISPFYNACQREIRNNSCT